MTIACSYMYLVLSLQMKECDSRLMNIRVPDTLSRPLRSLTDTATGRVSACSHAILYGSLSLCHG